MDAAMPPPELDLRAAIRETVREDAIKLLRLGHARLNPSAFVDSEEEDITGELVRMIKEVIADASEVWLEHYTVEDEQHLNVPGKLGKRRPRIDICVTRHAKRGRRPDFLFEAKRLKKDRRVTAYFGKDGIGCFLKSTYPLEYPEAAMLGYVQSGALLDWQERLGKYARRNSRRLCVASGGEWRGFSCALPHSSISEHKHRTFSRLKVLHLLLPFC